MRGRGRMRMRWTEGFVDHVGIGLSDTRLFLWRIRGWLSRTRDDWIGCLRVLCLILLAFMTRPHEKNVGTLLGIDMNTRSSTHKP